MRARYDRIFWLPLSDLGWACLFSALCSSVVFLGVGFYILSPILLGASALCALAFAGLYAYARRRLKEPPKVHRAFIRYFSDQDLDWIQLLAEEQRFFNGERLAWQLDLDDVSEAEEFMKRVRQARIAWRQPKTMGGYATFKVTPEAIELVAAERRRRDEANFRITAPGKRSRSSALAT